MHLKNNKIIFDNNGILIILSIMIGTIFTFYINSLNQIGSIEYCIKNIVYVILIGSGLYNVKEIKMNHHYIWVLSFIFSTFTIIGKTYNENNTVSLDIWFIISLVLLTFIYYLVMDVLFSINVKGVRVNKIIKMFDKSSVRILVIILCWLPYFLTFFPGIIYVDTSLSIAEFINRQLTLHYSVPYGAVVTFIYMLFGFFDASYKLSIFVLAITQMAYCVYAFNKCIKLLNNEISAFWKMLITLYFALNTTIALWSFNVCKDVIFSCTLILFIIETYSHMKKNLMHYNRDVLMYSLICCFLKNNAVYIFLAFAVILFFYDNKKFTKAIICICVSVFCFFCYKGIATNVLGWKNDSSTETLSVPLHQMNNVYYSKEYYTDKELETIRSHFDGFYWDYYVPTLADSSKHTFKNIDKDLVKLYVKAGFDNPQEYLDSFISLTYYSYYPDVVINLFENKNYTAFENIEKNLGFDQLHIFLENSEFKDYYNPYKVDNQMSLLPTLYKPLYEFCTHISFETVPVISKLFSISTYTYIYLILLFFSMQRKQYRLAVSLLPLLLLWGTQLLGPCTMHRYYLSFIYVAPLLIFSILSKNLDIENKGLK